MIVPPMNVRLLITTKFRSKHADRVKLLFWDGTGVCLLA